jgi:serum/glucocorticoid-regulated kinase 2
MNLLIQAGAIVSEVTSRGSALHIAAKDCSMEAAKVLINGGAEVTLRDQENKTVLEIPMDEEMYKFLLSNLQKGWKHEEVKQEPQIVASPHVFRPPKPPIVRGYVYKCGGLFLSLRQRYMVLNSDEGTLIRYKNESDYPLKPM